MVFVKSSTCILEDVISKEIYDVSNSFTSYWRFIRSVMKQKIQVYTIYLLITNECSFTVTHYRSHIEVAYIV